MRTSSGNLQELSVVFVLEQYQTYFLTLQNDDLTHDCLYFDLLFSITTTDYLRSKHQCDSTTPSLLEHLPDTISSRQLPFNLTGQFSIKYPEDFAELQESKVVAADLNRSLVIDTIIETGDSGVVVSAVMAQT